MDVPFGCSADEIERALLKFVIPFISRSDMHQVKTLFFVPVGLPGMGKSTLAKHLKLATEKYLSPAGSPGAAQLSPAQISQKLRTFLPEQKNVSSLPSVEFKKISYDGILGEFTHAYQAKHPDVPFHEVIDIIRADADQHYLDLIARHCSPSEKAAPQELKTIIFLDRNNTPDIWGDIKRTVVGSYAETPVKDYRTVVLLPKQEPFDRAAYRAKNPVCPHLIYECCKRIFSRKEHGCLSGQNKPKAVEVVLKFAKLHDDFDFDDEAQVGSYFD